jgi:hypothetical protein
LGKSHLFVPDPHATPDHHNKRFSWLGQLVVDLKPDVVICAGDWADMNALCSYDKGTKGYEGRRYKQDINAAIDAQERFFDPIKRAKKKLPRFVMLEGNHEHRIERSISLDAAHLDGVISQDDLAYEDFGWEYVRYEGSTPGIIVIDGIAYAHFFTSGVMNRAISGTHPAYQLLVKQFMSCTQGHAHVLDYCVRTNADGNHIRGLVAGCYLDYEPDYAGVANDLWWRGVVFKKDVQDGSYEPTFISLDQIREAYA